MAASSGSSFHPASRKSESSTGRSHFARGPRFRSSPLQASHRSHGGGEGDAELTAAFEKGGKDKVVILGFGRVGQIVAQMLSAHNRDYVAVDSDVDAIAAARVPGGATFSAIRQPNPRQKKAGKACKALSGIIIVD